jgi:NADPH-dependent 2,4-dienoyl-CoA reductase/sulfur reductase-like enzyme/nitrite reductase/ring-hydroxylating ferredoxin subunit
MPSREHDVAAVDDIPVDGMLGVKAGKQDVLLTRDRAAVYAVGGTCPHAGGTLAEGVRHDDHVICPWHKASFCLRTGALLDPPAMDALPRFATRVAQGRVLVSVPATPSREPSRTGDSRCFVIVGAGAAGASAAQMLREAGFGGRIVMLDRENRVPYDRTILSKYVLSGQLGGEKSPLQTQEWYRRHGIERRTANVVSVDPTARLITCADGTVVTYDAALLAVGGEPRRPPISGADRRNVFLLRSRSDADAILAQAERSCRAVILGSSFIGMEVAASLRERGLEVTVVGVESVPFEQTLGASVGRAWQRLHERRGVTFRTSAKVTSFDGGAELTGVTLDTGERIPADLALVGFGVRSATGAISGLPCNDDGSVNVDAQLRVADALYAAGDIARFPYRGDGPAIRVEHWRVAQQHGRTAALAMLGKPVRYDAVPVFWTIQYLKRLDYIGHASEWDEIVLHGDPEKPELLAYYVKNGVVAAAAGLGRDRDTSALVALMSIQRDWTAEALGASPAALLGSQFASRSIRAE